MNRLCHAAVLAVALTSVTDTPVAAQNPPNIIYIMADDLGYGDLGCFGQTEFQTPNIDQLAREGMKFTDHYSGHTVCRPSRLVLLTGRHSGNTAISANSPYVLPAGAVTVTSLLKDAGYATGGIGKWALGAPGTSGAPSQQGFDFWYGYLDQGDAHNFYPEFLWRNEEKETLPGNRVGDQKRVSIDRKTWSHDLLTDAAFQFIREHADGPFFLQAHYTVPHANNEGGRATGNGLEVPDYGTFSGKDWPDTEKGFASMVTRLDSDVGRLMQLLSDLEIEDNTVVFFTSDNGPHQEGGHKLEFFNSNGELRGYKRDLYEGGIRVPLIVRWPGRIAPNSVSAHASAFWDFLPTACELAQIEVPKDLDGISYVPAMLGKRQRSHDFLYWQYGRKVAVRSGPWKYVTTNGSTPELYNLEEDPGEQQNVSASYPEKTARLRDMAAGFEWTSLFDGKSLSGWRGYRMAEAPTAGWDVQRGILHCDGSARVDLITEEQYRNYELVVEWKTVPDGNSGIIVHADESTKKLAFNAPEIQIYATGERDPGLSHQAGALYALYPAVQSAIQAPMTWNTTRIIANGDRLAVFHNGHQICDAVVGSPDWNKKIAESKFADAENFGVRTNGHIGLQDHGRETWFRSVRLRQIN